MKRLLRIGFGLAALALAFLSPLAAADSIGPTCDTCQGSIYTLSYSGTALADVDPLHETFRIFYTIDTSGYSGGGSFIDAAAIKVSSSVFAASLFAAPGGAGNWTRVAGGINAGGCSGSGSGFECADYTGVGVGAAVGGTLTWVFDITVNNGALFTGLLESSIKARYVDANGDKVGDLVSENITLQVGCCALEVPEPQSLALLGIGLFGLALLRRKRNV